MEQTVLLALVIALFLFIAVSWNWNRGGLPNYWVWSWSCLIASGLLLAFESNPISLELSRFLAGLFAGLQLAGAYAYAEHRVPPWVWWATLFVATARMSVALAGYHDVSHLAVLPFELILLGMAARLVLMRERDAIDWALCLGSIALGAVHTLDAVNDIGRADGTVLWAPWLACGALVGMLQVGVVSERVQRLRTERTLARTARDQATQRLESLATLAGGVAHDFNNLLQSIHGNLELAIYDLKDDHPAKASLVQAQVDAERAAKLVEQMQIYASTDPFETDLVNLSAWLSARNATLAAMADIERPLHIALPPDPVHVRADLESLEQCLVNLISNAAEATQDQDSAIRLAVETVELDDQKPNVVIGELGSGLHVKLTIEDDGEGIEVRPLSRVFEPFFTTRFFGRGLGLSVAQQIVRAHNGAIDLKSGNSGTTVSVYLPAVAS